MRSKKALLIVIALCLLTMPTVAQEAEATAEISWPPPVYLLRGEVSLRGTVNLPGMTSYYIEYRALDDDLMAPDSRAYLPVTLPSGTPVVDDVLGTWDTGIVADGLYELRLNVVTPGGEMMRQVLGPLRVENERMPDEGMGVVMEEETPVPDESPRVTARVNANVRTGDSTSFRAIDALLTGESAPILGVSSRGSGWYQIALPNGRRGWISDVVVLVSGNIENLPRIVPPPLPPPPTITPVPANADLIVEWINFEPEQPRCNEAVKITAQIANIGSGNSGASGVILVQDWHINTGTISATTSGGFPALEPGQRFTAVMNLTVTTFYNEGHRLVITLDTANAVAESNEGNNSASRDYTLAQAGC
ncbi:MAG: SH3 domain-containing protein [Anaerolineae bacterium]|nr:SH3 domain-containing protein [Anaerolineae bacterium]